MWEVKLIRDERQRRKAEPNGTTQNTKQKKRKLPQAPWVYMILAKDSPKVRASAGATCAEKEWGRGFFRATRYYRFWFVVIPLLPRIRDTLPLRLMGRGKVLRKAIDDTKKLDNNDPMSEPLRDALVRCNLALTATKATSKKLESSS